MDGYLTKVIIVSVTVGIFGIIAPKHNGIEKYTKAIGLLCLLCVSIAPVREAISYINEGLFGDLKEEILDSGQDDKNDYSELLNEYLNSYSTSEFKAQVKDILHEKFNIPDEECEISITTSLEQGELKVNMLQILLSGKSIFKNPYTIEDYFKSLLNCECKVLIK